MHRKKIIELIALFVEDQNLTKNLFKKVQNLDSDQIRIIYELQAGEYTRAYEGEPDFLSDYASEIASVLRNYQESNQTLLDCGTGESNVLLSILDKLPFQNVKAFDVSLSRIIWANQNCLKSKHKIDLAVADLSDIPLPDNSIDCILTTHAIEPNGGRENAILTELVRVANKYIFLVEPTFSAASDEQKRRMIELGYAVRLETEIHQNNSISLVEKRLVKNSRNVLNKSAIYVLKKNSILESKNFPNWVDPIMLEPLVKVETGMQTDRGIFVPTYNNIPLLRISDCNLLFSKIPLV
jgi:hypothetical protein